MVVKLLTEHHLEVLSLKGGCRGASESTPVKMSHCWKSHALAHMGTRPLNKGTNRPITLCTVKLFIQLMYNKNDHLAKWSIFCLIFDVFFRLYNPFAP